MEAACLVDRLEWNSMSQPQPSVVEVVAVIVRVLHVSTVDVAVVVVVRQREGMRESMKRLGCVNSGQVVGRRGCGT
jgi:hypothetical protein